MRERNGKSVRQRPDVPASHKFCPSCARIKPHSDWHRNSSSSDGWASYCKPCRKAQGHAQHLKRTFGLTPEVLAQIIDAQDGCCAICRSRPPKHVDHDHRTGTVRGILCGPCNMGLGQYRDDPTLLHAAARYLRRQAPTVDVRFGSPFETALDDFLHGPAA